MDGSGDLAVSVAIPTYGRDDVLLETIDFLRRLDRPPDEIVVVDQTPRHSKAAERRLSRLAGDDDIRWVRLFRASIPSAMNLALLVARNPVVMFLDDDVIPLPGLVEAHLRPHAREESRVVAGQVLQPDEEPEDEEGAFRFNASRRQWIADLMAGNFSIRRSLALEIGGFDENFVHAAYRFETEFAERIQAAGESILFEPAASIRHLKAPRGGTRTYGDHLRTVRPGHAVGAYYYILRSRAPRNRLTSALARLGRSVRTRHHLMRPWWIPATFAAEIWGLLWAIRLSWRGPRLLAEIRGGEP